MKNNQEAARVSERARVSRRDWTFFFSPADNEACKLTLHI